MRDVTCDVAIIGAGTAGLGAYRSATREGASALIVERGPGGTTCARVGCMPSKLLIAAAASAQGVRDAGAFGIRLPPPRINGPAVMVDPRRSSTSRISSPGGMAAGFTAAAMAALPAYHPTLEESLRRALRDLAEAVATA